MLPLGVAFLAVLAVGEALGRRWGVPPELTRKLDHAAAGPIALAVPLVLDSAGQVLALAASFLAFLLVTRLVGHLGSVHGIVRRRGGIPVPGRDRVTWLATGPQICGRDPRSLADAGGGLSARWGRCTYLAWPAIREDRWPLA
jgi:hypothetical protein